MEKNNKPNYERDHNSHAATLGWVALGAGVLAWDLLAPETLSGGVDRALERHRIVTLGAIGITAAHLANMLPEKVDPFAQLFNQTRKLTRGRERGLSS